MVMIDLLLFCLHLDTLIAEAEADGVVVTEFGIYHSVIIIDETVIIIEDKVKDILLPCWFSDELLEKEFF